MTPEKIQIKHSFSAASVTYDGVALLQRRVGQDLLKNIEGKHLLGTVVDIGCGTGFLGHELLHRQNFQQDCQPEQFIALDIALPMLQIARDKLKTLPLITYLCADAESLPLLPHSMDWVLSNLAFQWCGDLGQVLPDIRRVLKPEGTLLFTTFGARTLFELKNAWAEVDSYAHVNSFHQAKQLEILLQRAGFRKVELTTHDYVATYESVWDLMAELKQLGASTVTTGRNKHFTGKATMQRMIGAYQRQNKEGLIPATFEVVTVVARS